MPSVTVRSIDALEELRTGLIRYADQAQSVLVAVQREVQTVLDWLDERVRYWQGQVRRWQEEEQRAAAAYRACLNSGDREHPPSCGGYEQAWREAQRLLQQAQAEERMAMQARQAVRAEAEAYGRTAARLRAFLQTDLPKAQETLRYKVNVLRSYSSGGVPTGVSTGSASADVVGGALLFGPELAVGAALGAAAAFSVSPAEGRELPLQMLHFDIHDVLIDQIDLSDTTVHGEADFRKIPHDEVAAGLQRLEQVRRWIGQGATDQMLRDIDDAQGLSGAQTYHNTYKIFYDTDSAIALEKVGGRYHVHNGYHRLAVAKELGWSTIPACIVGPPTLSEP